MEETTHKCRWCKEQKPRPAFSDSEWKYAIKHKQARCRECRRFDDFLRKYGMTRVRYADLLEAQKNACAVCQQLFRDGNIHIDHWHDSRRRVRGLLCPACNTGLGKMGDTAAGCLRAACYLLRAMQGSAAADERALLNALRDATTQLVDSLQ